MPVPQQLIDAIARQDVRSTILVLAYATAADVNAPYSKSDTRTALHIAAALGNIVLIQLLLWVSAHYYSSCIVDAVIMFSNGVLHERTCYICHSKVLC